MFFRDNKHMKIFQKKKTIDKNIYMPKKHGGEDIARRRKKRHSIFKKRNKDTGKRKFALSRGFLYAILILLFIGIAYLAIIYINHLRSTDGTSEFDNVMILGINDVPVYPEATFIFQNTIEEPSVSKFLSEGNSAYRLPLNTSTNDVIKFYNEKLPKYGWEFVLSVSVGSEDMRYGEYWIKEDRGLRIYSKFNDVWYQTITVEEAKTGLALEVKEEIARNLLLADSNTQDLLPDFPWIIEIPKEYVISYTVSSYKNESAVTFRKLGSSETVSLTPVASIYGEAFDYILNDYVKELNTKEKTKWGVKNTFIISTNTGSGLRGSIGNDDILREVAVISNPYNNVAYVLDSNVYKGDFFQYVLSNLEPQDKTKY